MEKRETAFATLPMSRSSQKKPASILSTAAEADPRSEPEYLSRPREYRCITLEEGWATASAGGLFHHCVCWIWRLVTPTWDWDGFSAISEKGKMLMSLFLHTDLSPWKSLSVIK